MLGRAALGRRLEAAGGRGGEWGGGWEMGLQPSVARDAKQ